MPHWACQTSRRSARRCFGRLAPVAPGIGLAALLVAAIAPAELVLWRSIRGERRNCGAAAENARRRRRATGRRGRQGQTDLRSFFAGRSARLFDGRSRSHHRRRARSEFSDRSGGRAGAAGRLARADRANRSASACWRRASRASSSTWRRRRASPASRRSRSPRTPSRRGCRSNWRVANPRRSPRPSGTSAPAAAPAARDRGAGRIAARLLGTAGDRAGSRPWRGRRRRDRPGRRGREDDRLRIYSRARAKARGERPLPRRDDARRR